MEWNNIFFKTQELNYLELFVKTSILYFTLFLADKSLGFRQPGIVTPYNFLVAAGISHIAASRMVQPDSRLVDAVAITVLYIALILLISYGYLKMAPIFTSKKQTILVEKGRANKDNLRKSMLTIDNMFSLLRQKNVFDLESVEYLIAEPHGDFSVAKKSDGLPISKLMMGIPTTPKELSRILIYDGIIDKKVLSEKNLDLNWVHEQLRKQNISDIRNVYIGLLTPQNELYVN